MTAARVPLDHPTPARPLRVYAALTNYCNRSCPWCSTCSSPRGRTFLSWESLSAHFPASGAFELQLEGGEPTAHPQFWDFVERAKAEPRCVRVVLCTNGVLVPRDADLLRAWIERFGPRFTLKLSINHHLLDHDGGLLALASDAGRAIASLGGERLFVVNVRLRPTAPGGDRAIAEAVEAAGLLGASNVFDLQRYGFASAESEWSEPFLAGTNFIMINPDGSAHGTDLVARSERMRRLP